MSAEPDKPHIPAKRRRGSAMHTIRTPYTSDQTARRQRFEQMRRLIKPTTTEPTGGPQ